MKTHWTDWLSATCASAAPDLPRSDKRAQASHIDVDHYTIDAQINPDTQTLNAHVAVRFVPLDDQTNSATFELNNNLNISQITDDERNDPQSSRNQADNTVRVTFPAPCRKAR